MKPHHTILLLAALAACARQEEGIDRTIIRGSVTVPPTSFAEPMDGGVDHDDIWEEAETLPMAHYRQITLNGNAASFGGATFGQLPDYDYYTLGTKVSGTLELSFDYATGAGMDRDKTIYEVYLYDLDNGEEACETEIYCTCDCGCEVAWDEGTEECVVDEECEEVCDCQPVEETTCVPVAVAGGSTNGARGHYTLSWEVESGVNYGLLVLAADSKEFEDGSDYTLTVASFTPDDSSFLVGAYLSSDPHAHGDPVGGGSVYDLEWDALNEMWTGKFEMLYFKSVVSTEEPDTGDTGTHEVHEVDENLGAVYLIGGTLPKLNASIPSGALYSTTAVEVSLGDHDQILGGWDTSVPEAPAADTGDTAPVEPVAVPLSNIVVTFDAVQPRTVGWEYDEVEPNEVTVNADYSLMVEELVNAGVLPTASGPGFVDIVHGSATIAEGGTDWFTNPNDIFALTLPEDSSATVSLAWDDCATDLDLHLYDSEGAIWAYSWYDCPEAIATGEWGVVLTGGSTWYIAVLPYAGSTGEHPYDLEIEYGSP